MNNSKNQRYLEAFRNNDQRLIHEMYNKCKPSFMSYIMSRTSIASNDAEDIYQESMLRIQAAILNYRLTEDNLKTSISVFHSKLAKRLLESLVSTHSKHATRAQEILEAF